MGNINSKSSKNNEVVTYPLTDVKKESSSNTFSSDKKNGVDVQESTLPSSIEGDDFAIPIKMYVPNYKKNGSIRSAVLFIHGGIFSFGDCHSHPTISEGLAKLGLAVVTASFRNGEEAPHKTNITMRDLRDVIDFVKKKWNDVPFGLVGSSSVSNKTGCNYVYQFSLHRFFFSKHIVYAQTKLNREDSLHLLCHKHLVHR